MQVMKRAIQFLRAIQPILWVPNSARPGCIGMVMGTASRILILDCFLLLELRILRVLPLTNVLKTRLKGVTDFYVMVSMVWFAELGLFVLAFYGRWDVASVGLVASLGALGLVTFLMPQFIFRQYLERSYEDVCTAGLVGFYDGIGVRLHERAETWVRSSRRRRPLTLGTLATMAEATNQPRMSVYAPEQIAALISAQTGAVGLVLLEGYLRSAIPLISSHFG